LEDLLRAVDGAVELPGLRHHEIHDERALSLLREDVVEIDILLVVWIPHRLAPERFLSGGEFRWPVTPFINPAKDVEEIRERLQDAARIEVEKAEHAAIGAARVVGKDGLQCGMPLCGRAPLLAGIARDADHSDLAVRPWLLRDPFDQIVMVRILVAVMAFGLRRSS